MDEDETMDQDARDHEESVRQEQFKRMAELEEC